MGAGWLFRPARFIAWGMALLAVTVLASGEASGRERAADPLEEISKAMGSGSYAEAEVLARAALAEAEASSGPDSLQVAGVLDLLVEALIRGGKATEGGSLELARRAVSTKEAALDASDPSLAVSLNNLGRVLVSSGDFQAAGPILERALAIRERALGPDHPEVAISLSNLGRMLVSSGDFQAAGPIFERALAIRERAFGPDHPEVASSLGNLAVLHRNTGNYPQAKALLERAIPILEREFGAKSLQVGGAMSNLGTVLANMGDLQGARSAIERSLAIRETLLGPDHVEVARSMDNLAVVLEDMGDYAAARPLFERALAIRERILGEDHPEVGTNLSNLANVLSDTGDLEAGRRLYERALTLQLKKLGPQHPEVAATMTTLAIVMRQMGDNSEARDLLERALRIREQLLAPEHVDIAWSLTNLAETYAAAGDGRKAEPLYRRAVEILTKAVGPEHPAVAVNLNRTGRLLRDQGLYESAGSLFERALAIWEKTLGPGHPFTAEGLADLASLRWRNGESTSTVADALRAEAIAREHMRDTARSLSERGALLYEATRTSGLDLALSVVAAGGAPGMLSDVWTELSRSRAVVLDEMAARHRALVELGSPQVAELRRSLELARNRLTRLVLNVPADEPPEDYRQRLQEAHAEKDDIERALAEVSLEYREKRIQARFGFDQIQAALPAGAGLVSYLQYDQFHREPTDPNQPSLRSYLAFVASPGGAVSVVPMGRAERIDALVDRWRHEMGRPPGDDVATSLRVGEQMRREVWDPVAAKLSGAEMVFIVPDGSLNLINFAALPAGDGKYLVETGPLIHYLSAERDLERRARQGRDGRGLMVIGAPDYESPAAARIPVKLDPLSPKSPEPVVYRGPVSACGEFRSMKFEPLPSALEEAGEVQGLWEKRHRSGADRDVDVLKLTGSRAGEAAFKASAPGRRVLHVATHGFFISEGCGPVASGLDGENPLLHTGLALAGANRRDDAAVDGEDGILTAEEIASLDLRGLEWAVLSSCGSGIGPVRAGEGVLGLRRTFQVAGARTLIMSLWAVEDHAARRWIRNLYEARLAGLSTAESVRRASLAAIETSRRAGSVVHPFTWGAFVAAGEWE